jgi:MYXO-CTERM domain-containing protein
MQMTSLTNKAALLAAAMMFMAAPAVAQTNDADDLNGVDTYATPTVEREDDEFPWGLLGLLGLAGLLGLKRKERDIHVDARRDTTRP